MKCPHCQAALTEEVTACPKCWFNYDSLEETFGRMPTLKGALSDLPHLLPSRQASKVRKELSRFERQFPQLDFTALITTAPSAEPLAKYAFWVFNGGGLCSHLHKGGLNFHILLVLDIEHQRANLSLGYGLEPFVSEDDLHSILSAGESLIVEENYGDAILAILAKASEVLQERSSAIPQIYGLRRKKPPRNEH